MMTWWCTRVAARGIIRIYVPETPPDHILESTLEWAISENETWVRITRPDGPVYESHGPNLWECLKSIRNTCEPLGVRICCNGARKDCYPSAMALQMGGGHKVIVREMGRPVTSLDSVVKLFDPADLSQVGTVAEQEAYYRAWLKTLPND